MRCFAFAQPMGPANPSSILNPILQFSPLPRRAAGNGARSPAPISRVGSPPFGEDSTLSASSSKVRPLKTPVHKQKDSFGAGNSLSGAVFSAEKVGICSDFIRILPISLLNAYFLTAQTSPSPLFILLRTPPHPVYLLQFFPILHFLLHNFQLLSFFMIFYFSYAMTGNRAPGTGAKMQVKERNLHILY